MWRAPRLLAWLTFTTGAGAFAPLAACTDSGQTGSPNHDPPGYETPGAEGPAGGGGQTDSGDGGGSTNVLPRPASTPGESALLGDTLLVAGNRGLTLLDAAEPGSPVVRGRLAIEGQTSLLRADSLAELVLTVVERRHYAAPGLPERALSYSIHRLLEVDATDLAAPRAGLGMEIPAGTAQIVPSGGGYALLGGVLEAREQDCAGVIDLPGAPPAVTSLWLKRYAARNGELALEREREFAPGFWEISSDRAHAVHVGALFGAAPGAELELEVIELASLDTVLRVRVTPAELGSAANWLGADYAGGVLLLAAGRRLLAWDAGAALGSVDLGAETWGVRFLGDGGFALAGGGPLVRVERGASAGLSLVPLSGGGPTPGSLEPFGDGFIAVSGVYAGQNPRLAAARYALDADGALAFVDQVQTDWFYQNTPRFRIDAARERLSYVLPIDDTEAGRVGVIGVVGGALGASELVEMARRSGPPLIGEDALYAVTESVLQTVRVDASSARPALSAEPPIAIGRENVRSELFHAGLFWTVTRTDTGVSSLGVRSDDFAAPARVDLPHDVESLLPIDATHVAAFGFSMNGQCEALRASYGEHFGECARRANGVSVLSADGAGARVIASFPLSSALAGTPPNGALQWLDWAGYFPLGGARFGIVSALSQECYSRGSCAAIGAKAYPSGQSTPSGCAGTNCPPPVEPDPSSVYGYRRESWLFTLDLSNPDAPRFEAGPRGGARHRITEASRRSLAPFLLGYGDGADRVRGYASVEDLFDDAGNGLADEHGQALSRHYLQLVIGSGGELAFGARVNVPGTPVLLAPASASAEPSAEHTVFTLEPAFRSSGEQFMRLNRARIEQGGAYVEETVEVGAYVSAFAAADGLVALLRGPADLCREAQTYELVVADVRGRQIALSAPLSLSAEPGRGYGLSPYVAAPEGSGWVYLEGGPAPGARLVVDVTTDPPSILRYETFEW